MISTRQIFLMIPIFIMLLPRFSLAGMVDLPKTERTTPYSLISIPGGAKAITVFGNLAYVGSRNHRGILTIVDVSNPGSPSIIGSIGNLDQVQDISVVGNFAFIADNGMGLTIVNVSNPYNPFRVSGVTDLGETVGIKVVGNFAYVVGYESDGLGYGLSIINISDPYNPFLVSQLSIPNLVDVDVDGNYAYAVGNGVLKVIDISDPQNPFQVASIGTAGNAFRIIVVGSFAYIADGGSGMTVINISDPINPILVSNVNTLNPAEDVDVEGNTAVVAIGNLGFAVIDVSDPINPKYLGFKDTPDYTTRIDILNALAYIADTSALVIMDTILIDPVPDIKANGLDGPLTISQGDLLTVTASLDPSDHDGEEADWWIKAETPLGLHWYKYPKKWIPSLTPIRAYGGPLFNLSPYSILDISSLPVGEYDFEFSVDDNKDGQFDGTYSDSVLVTVE